MDETFIQLPAIKTFPIPPGHLIEYKIPEKPEETLNISHSKCTKRGIVLAIGIIHNANNTFAIATLLREYSAKTPLTFDDKRILLPLMKNVTGEIKNNRDN